MLSLSDKLKKEIRRIQGAVNKIVMHYLVSNMKRGGTCYLSNVMNLDCARLWVKTSG